MAFGTSDDKPVAADYEGEGRTDIGAFRPTGSSGSAGGRYLRCSNGGVGPLCLADSTASGAF